VSAGGRRPALVLEHRRFVWTSALEPAFRPAVASHADLGFCVGWGAALDQLVALFV